MPIPYRINIIPSTDGVDRAENADLNFSIYPTPLFAEIARAYCGFKAHPFAGASFRFYDLLDERDGYWNEAFRVYFHEEPSERHTRFIRDCIAAAYEVDREALDLAETRTA